METRDTVIRVRFTRTEYEMLEKLAEETREGSFSSGAANLSGYIRKKVLEQSGQGNNRLERELRELNYQIRKIGVNINQIAVKVNSGYKGYDAVAQLKEELDDIREKINYFAERAKLLSILNQVMEEVERKENEHGDYETDEH